MIKLGDVDEITLGLDDRRKLCSLYVSFYGSNDSKIEVLAIQPTIGLWDQSNYQKPEVSKTRRHNLPVKSGTRRL